jgi:hypothetical protein
MENRTEFSVAMAVAIAEYRAAKADVLDAMRSGDITGDAWEAKQLRLIIATDEWGQIPRRYFSEEEFDATD